MRCGPSDRTPPTPAPRNIRIAYVQNQLLELARSKPAIGLVACRFDPVEQEERLTGEHVLAISEGGRSRTREYFGDRFGAADASVYSLDGEHLQDVVLGLRVRSSLTDPMNVLLTVTQSWLAITADQRSLSRRINQAPMSACCSSASP
ncbi:hypothetical protein ACIQB5_48105 [Streptomyces sp. NPDC088560]|uniref:hypothetical protein n=1 Tax=Streptomyces sp. NPDC088560 TaxID=3365868 RepID=UPI00382A8F8B